MHLHGCPAVREYCRLQGSMNWLPGVSPGFAAYHTLHATTPYGSYTPGPNLGPVVL